MDDFLNYAVVFLALIIIFFLVRLFTGFFARAKFSSDERKSVKKMNQRRESAVRQGLLVTCPVCNSALLPGEDLFTKVFRPMNVPDQLCTINGCPHCYPWPKDGVQRICPVCGKRIPIDGGHLIARLFNKSTGKKHVVVTGCSECCKSGRN